ncbi:MAG: hypothetical protein R3270_07975 [Gammaproteobacteria bacterium]|nr:hypothetical protein [Gammaproteobacteria bacterium]
MPKPRLFSLLAMTLSLPLLLIPAPSLADERPNIDYLEAIVGTYEARETGLVFEGESIGFEGNVDLGKWRVLRLAGYRNEADGPAGLKHRSEHYELGLMMDAQVSAKSSLLFEAGVQHDSVNRGRATQVDGRVDGENSNSLYGAVEYRVLWGSSVEFGLRGQAQNVLAERRRVMSGQLVFNFTDRFAMALRHEQWQRGEDDYAVGEDRSQVTIRWKF